MEDLSAKLGLNWETGLTAGESMAGGNTTAYDPDNIAMKGPGSESVYPRPESTDEPNLDISPVKTPNTVMNVGKKTNGSWNTLSMTTGFTKAGE
jgi:hypothetical protein